MTNPLLPNRTSPVEGVSDADFDETKCNSDGGVGLGAGVRCRCVRAKGHPIDSDRPHGCRCGALWADRSDT